MVRVRQINWLYAMTIAFVIIASYIPFHEFISDPAILLVTSQLIVATPMIVYLIITKQKYSKAVGFKKVSGSNIVLLIVFAFCAFPVMTLINALSRCFAQNVTIQTFSSISEGSPFIVSLICMAIVPAVFEESVYRGIFYQEYRKVNPLGAIFLSGLLFGLMHGNLNQFSYAFIMGMIFALMIEATDSILSSMIIHLIINGSSVVHLYVLQRVPDNYKEQIESAAKTLDLSLPYVLRTYVPGAVIFGTAAFFIYRVIAKNTNRWEHIINLFNNKGKYSFWKLFSIPLIVAIVYMITNMIYVEFLYK